MACPTGDTTRTASAKAGGRSVLTGRPTSPSVARPTTRGRALVFTVRGRVPTTAGPAARKAVEVRGPVSRRTSRRVGFGAVSTVTPSSTGRPRPRPSLGGGRPPTSPATSPTRPGTVSGYGATTTGLAVAASGSLGSPSATSRRTSRGSSTRTPWRAGPVSRGARRLADGLSRSPTSPGPIRGLSTAGPTT